MCVNVVSTPAPHSDISLLVSITQKAEILFSNVTMFYRNIFNNFVFYYPNICYHIQFYDPTLSGASIAPKRILRTAAMLVLLMIGS